MARDGVTPQGESLRQAVRWLSANRPITAERVAEAARRFDLSPLDEAVLRREFVERPAPREA